MKDNVGKIFNDIDKRIEEISEQEEAHKQRLKDSLELMAKHSARKRKIENILFSSIPFIAIIPILLLGGSIAFGDSFKFSTSGLFEEFPLATLSILTSVGTLVVSFFITSRSSDIELKSLAFERREINSKIDEKKELEIYDTIRLSLNQLNEYYSINKGQAKSSFIFSALAIILGLGVIILGILLYYHGESRNINVTALTGLSGLLLEFIGGAYFFMYKKSIEQVNFFFSQLIKVQDTMLAINLAKNMNDREAEITEKIILSLLERSLK